MRKILLGSLLLMTGCLGGSPSEELYERLLGSTYDELLLDIDYIPGHPPSDLALNELRNVAQNLTGKRVTILGPTVIPTASQYDDVWTGDDIEKLSKQTRTSRTDAASLHLLWLDGSKDDPSGERVALGTTHKDILIIYHEQIARDPLANPLEAPRINAELVERAVVMHEFGHALGLVGSPLPALTQRQPTPGDPHSKYRSSVMHPTIDSYAAYTMLLDGEEPVYQFDRYDLADIAAARAALREGG